jgi:hypothetical protein
MQLPLISTTSQHAFFFRLKKPASWRLERYNREQEISLGTKLLAELRLCYRATGSAR